MTVQAREVARGDASFVLDWLRQTNAPGPIIRLQERVVETLGGFMPAEERVVTPRRA